MENQNDKDVKIITIASGKGGVGKTNISLNLALSLAKESNRVCLLDADFGLANIDILLGISPDYSLMDFIEERCSLDDILIDGPETLKIVPGGSALERIPDIKGDQMNRLAEVLTYFRIYDMLVVDTSAGISDQILYFLEAADLPIVVVVPEPTSFTDAYSLLKTYHIRGNGGTVFILINQVKSANHAKQVYKKFKEVVDKYLGIAIKPIGFILADDIVSKAVSSQTPFIQLFPDSFASRCVRKIASRIISDNYGQNGSGNIENLFFPIQSESFPPPAAVPIDPDPPGMPKEKNREILDLFIKEGILTPSQVDYGEKVQEKLDTPKTLLETLKDLGYINNSQIRETLFKNRTRIRLGSLLVELGYISEKQLSVVLNSQKQSDSHKRIGELLVERNYITAYELTQVLSLNLGIPYIEPNMEMLDPSVLEKTSVQFFINHRLLPLSSENGTVNMVMADPLNTSTMEAAKGLVGPNFSISISMEKYIIELLQMVDAAKKQKKVVVRDESEVVKIVDEIINAAVEKGVSDIHFEPMKNRVRIRFRKDGSLIQYTDISKDIEAALVSRIKVMASANITERRRHQDGRILISSTRSGEEIDIRVSFYITIFGEKVVLRLLSKKAELYKVKDLGMGRKMLGRFKEDVLELPSGVVIITGPTGAGKTTTLYAAINYCNKIDTNIITAEEPVEYVIDGISQCSIDTKIGVTFDETLRHMLRQDPDIMILGEIRDKNSAESAIQAALTGHKVLTTFHTEDSIGGLLRLMNMDIESFLISSTVVCVVAQRLLKKVCPFCKKPYIPTASDLRRLKYLSKDLRAFDFQLGSGCERCDYTGYKGRSGAFEMLILNEYVKEAILQRKTSYEIRRICIETTGLVTLLEDGLFKASKGITSIQEVLTKLPLLESPRSIEQLNRLVGEL